MKKVRYVIPYLAILFIGTLELNGCARYCDYPLKDYEMNLDPASDSLLISVSLHTAGERYEHSLYAKKCCPDSSENTKLSIIFEMIYRKAPPSYMEDIIIYADSMTVILADMTSLKCNIMNTPTVTAGYYTRGRAFMPIEIPCGYKERFKIRFILRIVNEATHEILHEGPVTITSKVKKGWYSYIWPGN